MTDEERNQENQQSEATPTSSATSTPSAPAAQQPSPPDQSEEEKEEEKSPPYNLYFAGGAIAVGLIAYVVTILAFRTVLDAAAVTGALGALLTLIGTISGAYFGIKKSSDTEDKGRAAERAANKRVKEETKVATEAAGAMNPTEWEKVRQRF